MPDITPHLSNDNKLLSWFEDNSESVNIKKKSNQLTGMSQDFPGDIPVKNTKVYLVIASSLPSTPITPSMSSETLKVVVDIQSKINVKKVKLSE